LALVVERDVWLVDEVLEEEPTEEADKELLLVRVLVETEPVLTEVLAELETVLLVVVVEVDFELSEGSSKATPPTAIMMIITATMPIVKVLEIARSNLLNLELFIFGKMPGHVEENALLKLLLRTCMFLDRIHKLVRSDFPP
jgi:hypothetical protein